MAADNPSAQAPGALLIQFAREPQVGRVKTRMIPVLSASRACDLHCELTLWTCRELLASGLGQVELSVAGDTGHALFEQCLQMGVARITRQRGADLGMRMYNALQDGLARYENVILVGSDCPGIDRAYLSMAIQALHTAPIVLGPAMDGGYVLIGARAIDEAVFRGIPWGSDQVYAKTLVALAALEMDWVALPCLRDIDRPEDLAVWELSGGSTPRHTTPN